MNENKKNMRLRVAIILAALLLIVVIVMGIRSGRERLRVVPEVRREERVLEVQPAPPELGELEEREYQQELEEEIPEVRLEDIPFEQILEEAIVEEEPGVAEEEALEEERRVLDIVPSPEELKRIKEEGAVIY